MLEPLNLLNSKNASEMGWRGSSFTRPISSNERNKVVARGIASPVL